VNSRSRPAFQCRFRAPGQPVVGPILYALAPSNLGMLIVGRSQHGLCAILLGDDTTSVLAALREAFPTAELVAAAPQELQHELEQVVRCINGHHIDANLPLDLGGTAFQQQVWRALLTIPAGQTRTYSELAVSLGLSPRAARAVGGGCAANLLAVVVPCHRVVRGDAAMTGYRWGLQRKRALLLREQSADR